MANKVFNALFLCTHNSARSILAEAILNHIGHGRFKAYSAGSSPRDQEQPNPLGLEALQHAGVTVDGLRSKSWDEFGALGALELPCPVRRQRHRGAPTRSLPANPAGLEATSGIAGEPAGRQTGARHAAGHRALHGQRPMTWACLKAT